jgi:hypothetical protein
MIGFLRTLVEWRDFSLRLFHHDIYWDFSALGLA